MRFSFSKDFRGSAKRKTLVFCFFGLSLFYSKKNKGWRVRIISVILTPPITPHKLIISGQLINWRKGCPPGYITPEMSWGNNCVMIKS